MAEPGLQKLERSLKEIRIGAVRDSQKIAARAQEDGLIEREEQVQITVAGRAEEFASYSEVDVSFSTVFIDATGQRDSPFDRPHVATGSELYTNDPVTLTAVVMSWKTNDRNEILGCRVALGVSATDQSTKFRGAIHMTFQGYGQPLNTFNDEELT